MGPGALDPLTKELIYIAVSVTNACRYCIASHGAAARKKGMTDLQHAELVSIIGGVLSLGGGGRVIQTLLTIPLSAWTSVVIAYIYITHGPSAPAPEAHPGDAWGNPSTEPAMSVGTSVGTPSMGGTSRFCASCGSPLKADARFCANCGKPV